MRCPKCQADFESIKYDYVDIDRCSGCGGIWFDALEKEHLEQIKSSRGIDIGEKRVGRKFNEIRNINCPRCGAKMFTMADGTQFHVEYELCPDCFGTFFDAGEFKDLSELTIVERFRKMIDSWLAVR